MSVKDMYNNAKNNSIGKEKRCKKNSRKKRIADFSKALLAGTFIAITVTGCGLIKDVDPNQDIYDRYLKITEEFGVSTLEINNYQKERLYKLLDKYGIKYEQDGLNRKYNVTEEELKLILELDDSYLYTMYYTSSEEAANEMAKALGYESLDDYLKRNNYTDKDGEANYRLWAAANSISMAEKMTSKTENENSEGERVK